MPELAITLGPLRLRNPVICGSGEHVSTLDGLITAVEAGAAAVVAKSANESEAARRQADATAWAFIDDERHVVDPSDAGHVSMLNRSGLVQQPWDAWLATLAAADEHARRRESWVVASIIPGDTAALGQLARDVEDAGLRWLELNLSAPHAQDALPGAAIERPAAAERAAELTRIVREAVSIPVSVKLGIEHHDVAELAAAVRAAGADVVVLTGRHMGFLPDLETRRPVLGSFGGYSGPWALPLALRWVAKTRLALGADVPLIGTNGARTGEDVARFLLAGASAVQVASSVIVEGFGALSRISAELSEYLGRQGRDAQEIVGEAADAVMTYEEAAMRNVR
jgi:dihydroorotate dehydrogenase (NAD+) catalytic subunit